MNNGYKVTRSKCSLEIRRLFWDNLITFIKIIFSVVAHDKKEATQETSSWLYLFLKETSITYFRDKQTQFFFYKYCYQAFYSMLFKIFQIFLLCVPSKSPVHQPTSFLISKLQYIYIIYIWSSENNHEQSHYW